MNTIRTLAASLLLVAATACNKAPRLDVTMSDKFEGQTVELVDFLDSTVLDTQVITDGHASFSLPDTARFTALLIDGRTRAFYISEPGTALVTDSTNAATGTPLNDRFAELLARLDSVENLDDMEVYAQFAAKAYNETKGTPLASYFGIEWMKYAPAETVDSLLEVADPSLADSPKAAHYREFARLRSQTAPGRQYIDFDGENEKGKTIYLSSLLNPGGFTLVDFMASWCPYCIKEMPELTALQEKWGEPRLRIVSVAVRDVPDDTKAAVAKNHISWPVLYNTQRKPYDIYGFSGIPHHILIDADGVIVSRGETVPQVDARLGELFRDQNLSQHE